MTMHFLAGYIPFVNPIPDFHKWWYVALVPLSFGISMIYKAVRLNVLSDYWRQVMSMTLQIVLAMIGLGVALIVFVRLIIPLLPVN